jgi:hypothetical protein
LWLGAEDEDLGEPARGSQTRSSPGEADVGVVRGGDEGAVDVLDRALRRIKVLDLLIHNVLGA